MDFKLGHYHEVRPESALTPRERAEARDSFVRDFERSFSDWSAIAKCCIEVERDKDYEILGYSSWHAWLLAAAPRSRSYIYLVVGRYKELSADVSEEELAQIPLGSAGVLRQLSSATRRDPSVRKAATQPPKEFRQSIRESHPEQFIESIVEKKLRFTASQWDVIDRAYEAYQVLDPGASLEIFLEWLVSEAQ
jgi:hypothetical protein